MFDEILIFGALGILAGLLAGMFGIGGGLIIVPVLIGTFLSLDNKIIAAHLGYIYNQTFMYLFPVYDKDFSNFSPGNILLLNLINSFFHKGGNEIDFTIGDETYKKRLSNKKEKIYYKNLSLNFKGSLIKVIIEFFNIIKEVKIIKHIYQKIKY